jgi:hypothetical protein
MGGANPRASEVRSCPFGCTVETECTSEAISDVLCPRSCDSPSDAEWKSSPPDNCPFERFLLIVPSFSGEPALEVGFNNFTPSTLANGSSSNGTPTTSSSTCTGGETFVTGVVGRAFPGERCTLLVCEWGMLPECEWCTLLECEWTERSEDDWPGARALLSLRTREGEWRIVGWSAGGESVRLAPMCGVWTSFFGGEDDGCGREDGSFGREDDGGGREDDGCGVEEDGCDCGNPYDDCAKSGLCRSVARLFGRAGRSCCLGDGSQFWGGGAPRF